MNLKQTLREIANKDGRMLQDIAESLGTTRNYFYQRVTLGRLNCEVLLKIAKYLNVDLAFVDKEFLYIIDKDTKEVKKVKRTKK